ncbi:nucleosidase [Gordonia sp. (in: high G+C Gram-positive bacteria)]|uniref:nucleosidase n=1 Tax=Gordonia sp. (in: high G+C Gram-positive bacteria) TaxID=84139 RepID=UPI00168DD44E|nr:nucleosidase [Gordonia sp. (in: high G+C Gram-positive bacteria)]NLG48244.1 nucleosidase [Gordonia sp. (in: high G+C Gram-positive bacteria)]
MSAIRAGGVLVVAATKAEAAHVPPGTELLITGIGKVRAASAVARRLALGDYGRVVNIGTSGALRDGRVGLFTPSRVVEHDISAVELAAMGYHQPDEWEIPDGDGSVLATGDMFVTDAVHRARLAQRADLVDMEGAAVVAVCAEFGVPVRLVKVVSDNADEESFDWPSVIDAAARQLGEWLAATGFGEQVSLAR